LKNPLPQAPKEMNTNTFHQIKGQEIKATKSKFERLKSKGINNRKLRLKIKG